MTIGLVLLFVIGLILVFNSQIQRQIISKVGQSIQPTSVEQVQKNIQSTAASFDFAEVETLTFADVLKAQTNKNNLPVIGTISIPTVEMQLPILKGVGRDALAVGAGTMKPNQVMGEGNYSLAGHYFDDQDILFSPLYDLQMGDKIYITDLEFAYIYETTFIEVIEATRVQIIEDRADEAILTLITCAEKGTKRLAVQAQFSQKVALKDLEKMVF